MQAMAILITYMDNGNGLLDRMLFSVPTSLRPTPHERNNARAILDNDPFDITEIYKRILNKADKPTFYWSEDAQKYV